MATPIVIGATLLAAVPPPVDEFSPVGWTPGPGASLAVPTTSAQAVPVSASLHGPEDIAIGPDGAAYTGDRDGRIWRLVTGGEPEVIADVGGRPLGLAFDDAGTLLVANHGAGLQAVLPSGQVRTLVTEVAGKPVRFANDLVIGADGVVWFTDSSSRYNTATLGDAPSYLLPDLVDGRASGRLLAYDPTAGNAREVLDGLYFPNGVVLADDGRHLWIAESNRYRILRHSLTDGTTDVLIDDLPGVPDGLNAGSDGSVLVALYDRPAVLDRLVLPTAPGRHVMARLPGSWFVNEDDPLTGGVLVLDPDGAPRRRVMGLDPAGTNVVPSGDQWRIGALLGQPVRVIPAK